MRPQDQHFVPACYLRSFLPDHETALHVLRRKERQWFRQKPERIATRKNYYSILRNDGSLDDSIEHSLSKEVESPGIYAIRFLTERRTIPSWAHRLLISSFLAFQYTRVPQIRENVQEMLKVVAEQITEEVIDDTACMTARLITNEGMTPVDAARTLRQLRDHWEARRFRPRVRNEASLKILFGAVEQTTAAFFDMDWLIYTTNDPAFFTSDSPLYISPSSVLPGEVGMNTQGAIMHIPLSSRCFLTMRGIGNRRRNMARFRTVASDLFIGGLSELPPVVLYKAALPEAIRRLNEETAISAGDWICGPFQSEEMVNALRLPRARIEYQLIGRGSTSRVVHRLVKTP